MAAEDELDLPKVPPAKEGDPEDVSWALSTAEAMWSRGEHLDGLKWVRKAAEAAADASDDARALELAKAASELAASVDRPSDPSAPDATSNANESRPLRLGFEASAPPSSPRASAIPPPVPKSSAPRSPSMPPPVPSSSRSVLPPAPASSAPASPSVPPAPKSSAPSAYPPLERPTRTTQAPPTARMAPRPLATEQTRRGPQPGKGILSNRGARPSEAAARPTFEEAQREVQRDGGETGPQTVVQAAAAERALERGNESPETTRGRSGAPAEAASDEHADQALFHLDANGRTPEGDRKTTSFAAVSVTAPSPRTPPPAVHDPEIQTSQAVRVVVWRDAQGVHVAPAGTVVSSITIDAVLVVLEPSADLTAWLSPRTR